MNVKAVTNRRIHIMSDRQAPLKALLSQEVSSRLVTECLNELGKGKKPFCSRNSVATSNTMGNFSTINISYLAPKIRLFRNCIIYLKFTNMRFPLGLSSAVLMPLPTTFQNFCLTFFPKPCEILLSIISTIRSLLSIVLMVLHCPTATG